MLSLCSVTDLVETPGNPLKMRIVHFNTRIPKIGRSRVAIDLNRLTSTFSEFENKRLGMAATE